MKITFAIPHSGCAWWRCRQPANMIKRLGLAEVKVFDIYNSTEEELSEMLSWGEVIVSQSVMDISSVVTTAKYREMGKTVVIDYDDLSFSLSPFNPAYKTLGLQEVKIRRGDREDYLWQDNKNGFSIKANYFRYKSLQDLLRTADAITTTTKFIKDKYSEFSNNIFILPNSIDFNLFKPFPKKENKEIRIGWEASDSHHSEVWMVKRIMRRIFDKYKDKVRFVLFWNISGISEEFIKDTYERHDFIGLDTYPLKLASLNLDIAICPLENIDFNMAKSQLKWSEMAALKVPSVCSKIEAYDCVEDGITGLVADNETEFYEKICELVDSGKFRQEIAQNAYDKNYEDYNLEKNAVLLVEAYEQTRDSCESQLSEWGVSEKGTQKISQILDTK